MNGTPTTAWYDLNTTTGEMVAESQDGGHQGLEEFAVALAISAGLHAAALAYLYSLSLTTPPNPDSQLSKGSASLLFAFLAGIAALPGIGLPVLLIVVFLDVSLVLGILAFKDPSLPPEVSDLDLPFPTIPSETSSIGVSEQPDQATGQVEAELRSPLASASGTLSASWSNTATSSFLASALSADGATIANSQGQIVGTGSLALAAASPVSLAISGSDKYSVIGQGRLSFYGPAESTLGVSGDWQNYTASVTGDVTMALSVPAGALTLNGQDLPAATYTITTNSATLSGGGTMSSPNFAGSASITATNGTLNLGPGTGNLSVGGKPLNPDDETTLDGYSGTINVSANADATDSVSLSGNAGNVLQVTTNPSTLSTDQNTPITFATNVQTSLADTYNFTVNAPTGWTVSIDSSGNVTATPAPGLQSGTYPIQIIAQSQTDSNLDAQTTVDVTITPTQPGINFTVAPDPQLTVPFNGAQLPTAFRASIQNLGPAADTYNLTFSNVPSGFSIVDSSTSDTVPAGATGILGIYLVPNPGQPIPPPGTQLSFTVTATSASNSTITQMQTESFTVPVIDAVSLASSPTSLSSSPGVASTATLTLQNDGNVPETVSLSDTAPTGVTVSGLSSITIAPGATQTETVTVTPASSAALDQTLAITFTATFGPSSSPVTTTAEVDLLVTSAQAAALAQASVAAGAANNSSLASVLSDLGSTLEQLQTATSPALFTEAQNDLANLSKLVAADPALAQFSSQLQPIITAANSSDLSGMLAPAQALFQSITGVLSVEATEQFTVSLTPVESDLDLGQGETLSVTLTDTGSDPETLSLSAGTLPNGVTVSFGQTSVSLTPNQSVSVPVTLTQNLQSASDFELEVSAAATVVQHTDTAMIVVQPSVADVLSVGVSPATISSGAPITVTAEIFNTANVSRQVQAQVEIIDASNNAVGTPTDVPVDLEPGAGSLMLNLGQISTTGLPNGLYAVNVSLITANGTALPGNSSQSDFEIGQPVTATVAASTSIVPPGSSSVTTTISVVNNGTAGPSTPAVAAYDAIEVFYASNEAQNQFGVGNKDGAIFAIENASSQNITGGVLTVNPPGGPSDSFNVGTVPAGQFVLVEPGISNDGGTNHTFFKVTGTLLDESDSGPNSDDTQFEFTGTQGGVAIDSGIFTPAATKGPSNDGKAQSVNFLGGPGDADGPCTDCFGPQVVATFSPQSGTSPQTSPISVEVGYADDLRRNPFYPNPWNGSPNTLFVGENSSNNEDSGAIRIINNESTSITINDVSVTTANGAHYDLWGSNVLPAGDSIILSQTNGQNFDTSDSDITLPYPQTYPDGETLHAARINITVNGVLLPTFLDTGHVLTTGGSDPGGAGVNESQNWRPIGTTGEDNPGGLTATVTVTDNLPSSGYTVDPSTISPTATTTSASQVSWAVQLPPLSDSGPSNFALTGTVANIQPGEVQQISAGSTVTATFATSAGQVLTNTINLPALLVASEHIISIDPPTQTVDLDSTATYTVSLTNPLSTDVAYNLSTTGLDGLTVGLASSIDVPAGQTVTTPLTIQIPINEIADRLIFTVNAADAAGAQDSVEGQLIVTPQVVLQPRAVSLSISPAQATAGQDTSAQYGLTVTNVGTVDDTYALSTSGLPSGVTATLGETTIDVPPGVSNFRDVPLNLAVAQGTAPGSYPFTVTATSTNDATVTSTADGTLTVTANGVQVTLTPGSGAPGSSFQAMVTNTGTVTDTYTLALAGPAALVSKLNSSSVTLSPGASQNVPITTGEVNFAVQGSLPLTAMATSTTNPAIQADATSNLTIAASQGMTAEFNPASQTLATPGMATFLLMVQNTGNMEDSYSATIMGENGPVTATLVGLDGSPTQSIPTFILPGLSTGAIELEANAAAVGQGTVTVMVQSLTSSAINASPTATVVVMPQVKKTTPPPAVTDGPQITLLQRYGYHMMPTSLVLTFDQALDAVTADDPNNFAIIGPRGRHIRVKSAIYNPADNTVTLHPTKRINIHYKYELIIDGAKAGDVTDAQGLLLDGAHNGKPGSNYKAPLTWRNLVLPTSNDPASKKSKVTTKAVHANSNPSTAAAGHTAKPFARPSSFRR